MRLWGNTESWWQAGTERFAILDRIAKFLARYLKPGHSRVPWLLLPLFLLSVVLTTSLAIPPQTAIAQQPRPEIRGVWITSNDMDILQDSHKLQTAIGQLKQLNFNTLYTVVWNAGYALYPSAVAQREEIQPFVYRGLNGQDMIADVINQGHNQGLLVIPWFEFGFMAPPTSELATLHPNWLTQRADGSQTSITAYGEVAWLNPFHPEVQQFITDLVLEVVTQYDADGIQFDDHMSLPVEFGYDAYTTALYTKETKKKAPLYPQDPDWLRWRANKITAFIAKLRQAIKARKPAAIVSVSPNYYEFAYKLHLQDWLSWVRQNLVDELIVQVYRADFQSFWEQINLPEIQEARQKVATGIGILTGLRNQPVSMQQIESQVRATQEQGLGVAFFYYESLWNQAPEPASTRIAGFQSLFPLPALRSASGSTGG